MVSEATLPVNSSYILEGTGARPIPSNSLYCDTLPNRSVTASQLTFFKKASM